MYHDRTLGSNWVKRRLLYGHDQVVLDFVADRAPIERPVWRDVAAAIGILRDDGALIGGVVISEYSPQFARAELSVAVIGSYAASTQIVREIGSLAFGQLAIFRLFARTSDRNWRAKRALKALGFRQEGIKVHHYGLGNHAADWRVIRPEWEARWGQIEALQKAA